MISKLKIQTMSDDLTYPQKVLYALAVIGDAVIALLSLGLLTSNFSFQALMYAIQKRDKSEE